MITLTSDFGSPYPAAMKGVILQQTSARLVDVAHDFPRQDVRTAAFWLREILPYFPPAVHLVVVDPGVGTDRRALVLRAGEHAIVGPDNGVLVPAARVLCGFGGSGSENGGSVGKNGRLSSDGQSGTERRADSFGQSDSHEPLEAFEIHVEDPASATFHGRDVFAPAAADVHEVGVSRIEEIGRIEPISVDSLVDYRFPEPTIEGDVVRGEVLVVDDFGNAITNVSGEVGSGASAAVVDGVEVPVVETFAAVEPGECLITVGSHGYLECDVNRGRGDEAFDLEAGDSVTMELVWE